MVLGEFAVYRHTLATTGGTDGNRTRFGLIDNQVPDHSASIPNGPPKGDQLQRRSTANHALCQARSPNIEAKLATPSMPFFSQLPR